MITALLKVKVSRKVPHFYTSPKISFQKRKDLVLESLQTPNSDAWGEPHAYGFFKKYVFHFLSFRLPFIQQEPRSTLEH